MYIGKTTKTIESRFKKHIKDNFIGKRKTKICNALRKYGKDNFIIEEICQCSSKEELNEKEIYYIALYKTQELGYNISKGGDGGITPYHTNEKQISLFKARKGKTYEEIYGEEKAKEIKEKISIAEKGKIIPEECKEKIRIGNKKWWEEHYEEGCKRNKEIAKHGKEHHMYGKTHTEEARKKISESKKGKTYEEIYGEEKAKEIKEYMHKRMSGKNSPSYKNIDMISLFKELKENPFIKIDILAKKYKLSSMTMSKKIKDILNIDNIQKYRYNKSEVELKKIFGEIYDKMVFGKLEN